MVSSKMVDVGQYVTVGSRLGETFAIDFAEVRIPLTEKDLSKLDWIPAAQDQKPSTDKKVILRGSANGYSQSWQADLVRSEGKVEQINRAQYLVAQVADPYNIKDKQQREPLLIGTFVEVAISGKVIENVYPLPRYALRSANRVAIVDSDQRLKLVNVAYSYEDQDFYFIDQGLEGEVEVVTSGMGVMVDGMKLKSQNSLKAAAE